MKRDLDLEGLIRARMRPRLPVVMTVEEVRAVLERLEGVEALEAGVLYGGGLRLMEVLRLRVHHLAEGYGRVRLPNALERKYPHAPVEWGWQWVFPQQHRWHKPNSGEQGRHHLDPSVIQKAVRRAVLASGIITPATSHTFRHSQWLRYAGLRPDKATQLQERGQDIRTIQELLRHSDIKTTMIYTHVLNRGPLCPRSPADLL